MPTFIALLQDDDLAVKNVALLMVYSAVHNSPQLVVPHMKLVLPKIDELAQLNMERKIDLGPFKHTVDDALPLRKAALSVFSTCLEKCPASLDIPAFMPTIAKALGDSSEDIQLQTHQIVLTMCSRYPIPLVAAADTFVAPLEKTVNKKKGQKTGTELERVYEWIKSGLRVMIAVSKLDGAMSQPKFSEFVDRINTSSKHAPFLNAVEDE